METNNKLALNLSEKQLKNIPNHILVALGENEETMVRLSKQTAYDLFMNLSQYFAVFAVDNHSNEEENAARIFCPYRQVEVEMTADSCQVCEGQIPFKKAS